jgi:mRNA interferase MazF
MTIYRRGDVLLVRFPNSDLVTYKKRPALVIQDEVVDTGLSQCLVAMITSNLARTGVTRVLVQKDSPAGQAMGLITDSVIVADNIATIREREIDKILGHCPRMPEVDAALRKALRL